VEVWNPVWTWDGYMKIYTTNPQVIRLIEEKFGIKLRRMEYYSIYESIDEKLAAKIGSYMVELKKQGYRL